MKHVVLMSACDVLGWVQVNSYAFIAMFWVYCTYQIDRTLFLQSLLSWIHRVKLWATERSTIWLKTSDVEVGLRFLGCCESTYGKRQSFSDVGSWQRASQYLRLVSHLFSGMHSKCFMKSKLLYKESDVPANSLGSGCLKHIVKIFD